MHCPRKRIEGAIDAAAIESQGHILYFIGTVVPDNGTAFFTLTGKRVAS